VVAIPLEASLSASRRVVAFAAALAPVLRGRADRHGVRSTCCRHWLPPGAASSPRSELCPATVYAAALAFGRRSLSRTGVALLNSEEDRYRLLARNMSDVISRHRHSGAVQFISAGGRGVARHAGVALLGHGLFDRVHVADRPGLPHHAVGRGRGGEAAASSFRLRRDAPRARGAADSSGLKCVARPLEQAATTAASDCKWSRWMRDVTDRKIQEQALDLARHRRRTGPTPQEPLPCPP